MKKVAFISLIMLIAIVFASGCLSDDDADAWNEQIDVINTYVNKSVSLGDEIETAYNAGNYDIAIQKVDLRLDALNSAHDEIIELVDVAKDLDKDFLEDYAAIWKNHTEEIITYNENLRNILLIYIVKDNEDASSDIVDLAFSQYLDAQDYFNSNNYQAAASTAELSKQKWTQVNLFVSDAYEAADDLGVSYVKTYTSYQMSASDNAMQGLDYLMLSSNAAYIGDIDLANTYIDTHNFYDAALAADLQSIQNVKAQNPEAFAIEGNSFQNLADEYAAAMDAAEEAADEYSDQLDDIENEHDDFFEER